MVPPYLQANDLISIVSPSGAIDAELIDGATKVLQQWNFRVTEGKNARNEYGRFAGTQEERIADLQEALDNPEIKAILCSRGGYGLCQIIDRIDFSRFVQSPKWLIGFSDITILHNSITNLGIASLHGLMSKHLCELPSSSKQLIDFQNIITGKIPKYTIPTHSFNKLGRAEGKLIGGNLSVMIGLRGSKFDLSYKGAILFIEDIAEKPYHIDRMMQNLRLGGVLAELSGLVVGQFSDCEEDPLMMKTITEIIADAVRDYDYPVCFNFPTGHVDYNLPLVLGCNAKLNVDHNGVQLSFE